MIIILDRNAIKMVFTPFLGVHQTYFSGHNKVNNIKINCVRWEEERGLEPWSLYCSLSQRSLGHKAACELSGQRVLE